MKKPQVLVCKAGDLCLWDSRTVHCNTPCLKKIPKSLHKKFLEKNPEPQGGWDLIRMVCYICMVPSNKADYQTLKYRQTAFNGHITTSHWPHK